MNQPLCHFVDGRRDRILIVPTVLIAFLTPLAFCAIAGEQVSIKLPGWIGSVAFSPGDQLLAASCSDNTARLLKASTGEDVSVLRGHRDYVVAVAFSPDGQTVATGSYDQTARIWDVRSAESRFVLQGHRGGIMSVAFSPDGKLLASASIDGTVKLWNCSTDKLRRTLRGHKSWVNSVVFAPDGSTLLSGSSDGTIKLWDVRSQRLKKTIEAADAEVRSVATSRDGKMIAAGIRYGMVKVWLNGKESLSFKGHESDVWSVTFTPDGTKLISADGDWNKPGQIKFWDSQTGKLLATLEHSGEVLSVACSADGRQIAAGGADKVLKVWELSK